MVVSIEGHSIADEFRSGAWSARHVYDACEPAPTLAELREERLASLTDEYPHATYGARFDLATVWAEGWLAVAHRARVLWIAEQANADD